ncbi:hypothetical protein HD554DRAFT_2055464 [Boletus coccyginus]|nr:hypothetical protein HD554DRAFT_2055464 [Boletus coccyginus]
MAGLHPSILRQRTIWYRPIRPYTRLLYTLFSLGGQFEVVPKLKNRMTDQDFVPVLIVAVDRHPVFFMAIKPPAAIPYDSERGKADGQMRRLFSDLGQNLDIPTLHGICAFGTRLSFYEYDSATQSMQPQVAPIGRWDCDVLQPEGADRLKGVAEKVKDMCAQL